MKKIYKYLFVLVFALVSILVACDRTVEKTDLEKALEATVSECKTFEVLTTINQGEYEIYKETANYSFSDGKFSYTSTVKKLNSLDSEEEFTTTEKEGKVDNAYFLELSVDLLEDVTVENGVLKAKLSVSGLEKLVNKDAKDGSLELKFNDDKVVSLVLVYTLNGQKTKIEANYSY